MGERVEKEKERKRARGKRERDTHTQNINKNARANEHIVTFWNTNKQTDTPAKDKTYDRTYDKKARAQRS
jgi:hypothetical protein